LITGGAGFIGSHVIRKFVLSYPDYRIINLDKLTYAGNLENLNDVESQDNYQFIKGDIEDSKLVDNLFVEYSIKGVIHLAAESHVDRSISDPLSFIQTNVLGTVNLLNAAVQNWRAQTDCLFYHISTDEVYGNLSSDSAIEETRFNPSSPYAATKASAEILINSYKITYDCDCLITRCTNNFGPRQFPEKLIPKVILLANQNKKIPMYGNGKNIRDWLFVTDHCDAIINVLQNGKSGESYNISANNEIDNITIVAKILSLLDKSSDLIEFVEDRPGHDFRYSMDSSKIRKELDWVQKFDFDIGLKQTVDWYLSNENWWKNISEQTLNSTPWKNNHQTEESQT